MRLGAVALLAGLVLGLPRPTPASADADAAGKDELPVAALLAPFRGAEGRSSAHIWLEIPGPALLTAAEAGKELTVSVEVAAPPGRIEGSFSHTVDLADESLRDAATRSALRLHGAVELAPGAYTLVYRVTVDRERTGEQAGPDAVRRLAERRLPFEIAPFKAEHASLLPPFFVDEYGLDDLEDGLVRRGEADHDPFVTAAHEPFVPDVVPVVQAGERARLVLSGYHLTGEQSLLEAVLTTADGRRLGKERLALIRRHQDESGLERLDFALQTEGLTAGEYQLEVSIQDLQHGRVDQTLMPFEIR